MTNKCLQCNKEYEAKRSTSKYCSSACRKIAFLKEPVSVTVPPEVSVPEVSVPTEVNTIPTSKGGVWKEMYPWKPGMCKYCGTMTLRVDNVTIDEMAECCIRCASLKNTR